jgi:hypothetical protein
MQTKTIQSLLRTSAIIVGCGVAAAYALPQVGCSSGAPGGESSVGSPPSGAGSQAEVGEVGFKLTLPGGETVNTVNYTITGPNGFTLSNSVSVQNSTTISFSVGGIPVGTGYSVTISGTSVDGTVTCSGSATFSIVAQTTTTVTDTLQCNATVPEAGAVSVTAPTYACASIFQGSISASPTETTLGGTIALAATAAAANAGALTYTWSASPGGTFSAPSSAATNFTCTTPGQVTVTVTVGDGAVPDGSPACSAVSATVPVTCSVLNPGSLVISSSTYSNTQGVVASLVVGTTLPGSNGKFNTNGTVKTPATTVTAVAGNDYVNVWNNAPVDGSFGVTSEITLTDIDPNNPSHVFSTVSVPTNQVVTSFSSKSELGLHYVVDSGGAAHVVFVAYAGAGVGALDVSNSDAVPGQDPTNPVTFVFGSNYAFARTIVSMDALGNLTYTPTINYGGNNGRSGLLGSNGLYYTVGNANNGGASTFTPPTNGTSPDVTETTGVEVVNPINGSTSSVTIPTGNSAEVSPLVQFDFLNGALVDAGTDGGTLDKAGKDDNYRGLTEFGGAIYFTKGSGSNGIDTVYTVSPLPTVGNAASATISIVPGFPTDSAKVTGGNFTPFATFFANATTMYVTDEGSGNPATDGIEAGTADHAGLQKWSLVNGTWVLDYVLQSGAIGTVDNLTGSDGAWPTITTVGLRNLTGVVSAAAGTVTLWATTSTLSTSGDNGADPNKVVTITDQLSATTLPTSESFSVVVGPTYGTVYRGVAHVN